MENLYAAGDKVSLLNDPSKQLVIKRYLSRIYYCVDVNDPNQKLLAYFGRELVAPASL
jgi:hypothetical protein